MPKTSTSISGGFDYAARSLILAALSLRTALGDAGAEAEATFHFEAVAHVEPE